MADLFKTHSSGLESPASHVFTATPNDNEDLPMAGRALNVRTSGEVRLTTVSGQTETIFVAAGIAFPVRTQRIWQSGTTATGIVVMC